MWFHGVNSVGWKQKPDTMSGDGVRCHTMSGAITTDFSRGSVDFSITASADEPAETRQGLAVSRCDASRPCPGGYSCEASTVRGRSVCCRLPREGLAPLVRTG